jgi:hypothetical protein
MTDETLFQRALAGEIVGDGSRQVALLAQEVREYQQTFDLQWQAERRGIKCWQDATGRTLTWPDKAGFTLWLLSRLEHADIVIQAARELGSVKIDRERELDERDAAGLHLALHVAAYSQDYPSPMNDPDVECCNITGGDDKPPNLTEDAMNTKVLAEALVRFQSWSDELEAIEAETETDAADELMRTLYGDTDHAPKLIGGSNAPILMDAAQRIQSLQRAETSQKGNP